jgi:hypothetical protein
MTGKADFTPQEWEQVLQAPPSAAMMVIMAQRGGTFRETFSIAKTYAEARQEHGQSQLLDEIVAAKPEIDRTRYHSGEELKEHTLGRIRDAVAVLATKADEQELAEYKGFIVRLAERVARAHSEGDDGPISPAEQAAVGAISEALS